MTDTQTQEPTRAVARRDGVGTLPEHLQHALKMQRQAREVQVALSNMSWGEKLDRVTRHAVAEYAQKFGMDPATELYVLGGRIYRNAEYALRRLSELTHAGLVEYAYADHVAHDPRLDTLAATSGEIGAQAKAELDRRLLERIRHGLPDKAQAAVVFRVKLKGLDRETTGAKWCGGRGTYGSGKPKDPVGEEFPFETAETRAARRCLRQILHQLPTGFREQQAIEDAQWEAVAGDVEDALDEDARLADEQDRGVEIGGTGLKIKAGTSSDLAEQVKHFDSHDPYGQGNPPPEEDPMVRAARERQENLELDRKIDQEDRA